MREPFYVLEQLRHELRRQCKASGGQSAFARRKGLSRVYVTNVLAGNTLPGEKVLAAIGFEKVVLYRRKSR